jgi:hypothetical protein
MNNQKLMNDQKCAGVPQQHKAAAKDTPALVGASRFEKFAATQAAGDGIEGDVAKKDKTEDEKLGAQMADRK